MPRPRSAMRKVREVLRLSLGEQMSRRSVAAATGVPYSTIADCLARATAAGIGWRVPDGVDDAELERRLYPGEPRPVTVRPLPSWNHVHIELRRPGVTLQLLWLEYKAAHPDGYQYTQFVQPYREWTGHLKVVMRQHHRAGEKVFLDFSGQTVPIIDPATGEVWQAELFVAALGASSYTYAEVVPSQDLSHWVLANQHAFAYSTYTLRPWSVLTEIPYVSPISSSTTPYPLRSSTSRPATDPPAPSSLRPCRRLRSTRPRPWDPGMRVAYMATVT